MHTYYTQVNVVNTIKKQHKAAQCWDTQIVAITETGFKGNA
jgi:hypothetical protein